MFYPASPVVTSNVAGALTSRAAGQIAMVGLFVDADDVMPTHWWQLLNALQLHGLGIARTRGPVARAVWQAGVEGAARRQRQRCRTPQPMPGGGLDLVRRQDPKALPGAWGWRSTGSPLAGYRGALPWGLAGGLNRRMLPRRLRALERPLVDTSSGVESAPGVKDTDKITNSTKPSNT